MTAKQLVGQTITTPEPLRAWRGDGGEEVELPAGTYMVEDYEPEDRSVGIFGSVFTVCAEGEDPEGEGIWLVDAGDIETLAVHGWQPTPPGCRCSYCDDGSGPTKFRLDIDLGNAEMREPAQVAAALRRIADRIDQYQVERGLVQDANGNSCGTFGFEGPEDES